MEAYKFPTDPVPASRAVVSGPNYRFTLIDDVVLRYEWSEDGIFEDRASSFVLNRNFSFPEHQVKDTEDLLEIKTPAFHLRYDKKRFSPNGLSVEFNSKITLWGESWRYGDEPEENLGGTARTLDGVDGRCDVGYGIISRRGFAAVDDSTSMLFEDNGFVGTRIPGDRIDGYLFSYGLDYKKAIQSFYAISGQQPLLPRWALGNWWSRYYAYSADEYLALMDKFKEANIPLSVAVLDMDWHLVKQKEVPHTGWTGYTWDKSMFPDPEGFSSAIHERKLKISLNDHPHAGIHHHEDLYAPMADALQHDTSDKAPIPFDPTSPRFMNAYFNVLHRAVEKKGCDFWWLDWQQGAHSRVPGLDPLWLLNHFQFIDHQRQLAQQKQAGAADEQALILSRYGGLGSHRYPVGFSGDTIVTWESLQFQPEFTCSASNVGYGWWSHDIGGHMGGIRDDELATRWVQLGVFSPIFRLHSSDSPWSSKEPWLYRQEFSDAISQYMQLRHRFVPYIFTTQVTQRHEPLVQPMYWPYPTVEEAYNKPNQYMFGPDLLVAPIVHPRDARTNHASVDAWLPPGRHVDIFTGLVYDGDRTLRMYRKIQHFPILAAEGAIIPLDGGFPLSNGCEPVTRYEVYVVVGKNGEYTIIEDVEDGKPSKSLNIQYDQASGRLTAHTGGKEWLFRFVSVMELPPGLKVSVDGQPVSDVTCTLKKYPDVPSLEVIVPATGNAKSTVTVDLGSDPQLSKLDVVDRVKTLLLDFQMEYAAKDKVLSICQSKNPISSRVGNILSLGLDEAISGPLLEVLLARSESGN